MPLPKHQQFDFDGLEIIASEFTGTFNGTIAVEDLAAVAALTNSTGATANDVVENVPQAVAAATDTTAASLASVNTALTAIENDISDLTAKVNVILAALK